MHNFDGLINNSVNVEVFRFNGDPVIFCLHASIACECM